MHKTQFKTWQYEDLGPNQAANTMSWLQMDAVTVKIQTGCGVVQIWKLFTSVLIRYRLANFKSLILFDPGVSFWVFYPEETILLWQKVYSEGTLQLFSFFGSWYSITSYRSLNNGMYGIPVKLFCIVMINIILKKGRKK